MSVYRDIWTREEDLDSLQLRIHDAVPVDQLHNRARTYRQQMFERYFKDARPQSGDHVLEVGSGVGWIMQAVIEKYPSVAEVVGLDISENMISRAQERWTDPRARWQLYDGLHFPFPDGAFQVVYSCAALQHVEKHSAFFVFKEIHRVLQSGGHAVVHLMPTQLMSRVPTTYEEECLNHITNRTDVHWHHFYSFDELIEILSKAIGVTDLDLQLDENREGLFVHFSKEYGPVFRREELAEIAYPDLAEAKITALTNQVQVLSEQVRELLGPVDQVELSGARKTANWARSLSRRLAPAGTRRGAALRSLVLRLRS